MFEILREDLRHYVERPRPQARALLLEPGVWPIVGYRFARWAHAIRIDLPELIAKTDIEPMYVELLTRAATSVLNVDQSLPSSRVLLNHKLILRFAGLSLARCFYKPGSATARGVRHVQGIGVGLRS